MAQSRSRSRRLTAIEAAQLIRDLDAEPEDEPWDSEEEESAPEVVEVVEEADNEEDVPQVDEADEEQEEELLAARNRREAPTRQETVSEKKLSQAELVTIEQEPQVFSVSTHRDGVIAEWTTESGRVQTHRNRANILRSLDGLGSNAARNIQTELDTFLLFFSEDILQTIVTHTNEKLEEQRRKFMSSTKQKNWTKNEHLFMPIDRTELLAFFALNVLRGTIPLESATELFTGSFAPAQFRATMSEQRYVKLLSSVRFDDSSTRADRRRGD